MYRIAAAIASIMLVIAVGPLPYGYYLLMRVVAFGVAAYGTFLAYRMEKKTWVWILAGIALVFNPLLPLFLSRGTWVVVDLIAASLLWFSRKEIRDLENTSA